ncbi:MAG: SidA/IucD/PvdA family monooxygenase [Streptosporangiales bacterium]|nr:SidA/IucD/PvdA family monooxygenase [Streptosporangiales bacterium]
MAQHYDVVVVGGGQAGLAAGRQLALDGRELVVLDAAARVGDAWRQRWRSLRLFTPAAVDALPGMTFPAPRNHRPTKDEMADYLEAYAQAFALPVLSGCAVDKMTRADTGFALTVDGERFTADHVVVATGPLRAPRVPAFAAGLDPGVHQLHSADYVEPAQLPAGPVLVVGAGNSGGDIAMDLAPYHPVWLAGRATGRVPGWLDASCYQVLPHVRTDRGVGRAVARRLAGRGTPLVGIGRADLVRAGIRRVPRVTGVRAGRPLLADGRELAVRTVVWCTGYRPGLGWLDLPGEVPGLHFVGMQFQNTLASGIIGGAGTDAATVVAAMRRD